MRELNMNEIEQISGGFFTGPGQIFGPEEIASATRFSKGIGFLGGAGTIGWQIGTYVNNHRLSAQTQDAIGYTVDQMVSNPVKSVRNAVNFWF